MNLSYGAATGAGVDGNALGFRDFNITPLEKLAGTCHGFHVAKDFFLEVCREAPCKKAHIPWTCLGEGHKPNSVPILRILVLKGAMSLSTT